MSASSAFASAHLHFFKNFFANKSSSAPFVLLSLSYFLHTLYCVSLRLHYVKFPHSCSKYHIYSTITKSLSSVLHIEVLFNLLVPHLLCCNIIGGILKCDICSSESWFFFWNRKALNFVSVHGQWVSLPMHISRFFNLLLVPTHCLVKVVLESLRYWPTSYKKVPRGWICKGLLCCCSIQIQEEKA